MIIVPSWWRLAARGDELIGHGHTNAMRQGDLGEEAERALLRQCRDRMAEQSGVAPDGWLSPWISESLSTPDLLAETGYRYTLNWCHDDQPIRMTTRHGTLWSVPYSQEANDIPMIVARQMDGKDFAQLLIDQFDEMLRSVGGSAPGAGHRPASLHHRAALPSAPFTAGTGTHGFGARCRQDMDDDARRDLPSCRSAPLMLDAFDFRESIPFPDKDHEYFIRIERPGWRFCPPRPFHPPADA